MEMLHLFTLLTFMSVATAVVPQECPGPNDWFSTEFVSIVDQVIPTSAANPAHDMDLHFFREVLFLSEQEIEDVTEDAIEFFNTRYGLDFSTSQPDDHGRRFFENATFLAYEVSPLQRKTVTFNRWLINGRTKSLCFPNLDGGYLVSFSEEMTLYGTYGGAEGKVINPGEAIVYGFYHIEVCPQEPLVIQYDSRSPFRVEPVDGTAIINCNLFHRKLGRGIAQGVAITTPTDDPNFVHFSIRNAFTFPQNPGLP